MNPDTPLITDDHWRAMFEPDGLRVFVPKRGAAGFPPMLEAYCVTEKGFSMIIAVIQTPEFGTKQGRREIMHALGVRLADEGHKVAALRMASEAWTREAKDAQDTMGNIAEHPDRREAIVVAGQTMDDRRAIATAPIIRRHGTIHHLDPWRVIHHGDDRAKAETFLLTEAWRGYVTRYARLHMDWLSRNN